MNNAGLNKNHGSTVAIHLNKVYNNVSCYPTLARKQSKTLGLSISRVYQ